MITTYRKSHATTISVSIAVVLGALYWVLLHLDPMNALSGVVPELAMLKLRLADLLKPFVIACPWLAFTIPLASYIHNIETGRVAFGAYTAMPFISGGLMYLTYLASRLIGRGLLKDVAVNGVAGILLGICISVNITMISSAYELLALAISLKSVKIALVFIAGTLLLHGTGWRNK